MTVLYPNPCYNEVCYNKRTAWYSVSTIYHQQGEFLFDVARVLKKLRTSKGDLLDQAVVLFNCVPFQNGNFS